jgi:phosphoglucosamine mutase
MFEDALACGINSMGVNVVQVGPMPTPALAFLTTDMRCDAGVMITASHNPYQDNGIKFFGPDGFKLADDLEAQIEELVFSGELESQLAPADSVGKARRIDDATGRYIVYLKKTFPRELTLDGMRIVLDCANGAAYKVGPTVLSELGAEVFELAAQPDGRNINAGCGSTHPGHAAAKVLEVRADIGVALDGDADRVILIDERGREIDGDEMLALCARDLADRDLLAGGGIVATVMSNLGLEHALEKAGLSLERVQVGDRYVVEAMRKGGYNLGGEQSGHVIFSDHGRTGDGLMTALQVLGIMARTGRRLSDLTADFVRYPQILLNIDVGEKRPLESLPSVQEAILRVEAELGTRGRVLIRYSGTELKVRVMVEGEDEERVREFAEHLADVLRSALGGLN